jgi:nucleoid-associated protein YgaU
MSATFVFGLFIAITFFAAGIAIGGFFFSFRKKGQDANDRPETAPLELPPAGASPHADLDLALRVFRHRPSGKLVADIQGVARASGQNLTPEQKAGLSQIAAELGAWAGRPAAPPAPPAAPAAAQPAPTAEKGKPGEVKPPSTNPFDALRALNTQRARAVGTGVPASLAGRINAVLQELLADSDLRGADIELRDALSGGVSFFVRGKAFEFIDQIPDESVRALIQKAIKEWETRSGG